MWIHLENCILLLSDKDRPIEFLWSYIKIWWKKIFFCCLSRWISVPVEMVCIQEVLNFLTGIIIIKKDKNKRKYIYRRWILNLNPKSISMNNFFFLTNILCPTNFDGNNIIKLDRDFAYFFSVFFKKEESFHCVRICDDWEKNSKLMGNVNLTFYT